MVVCSVDIVPAGAILDLSDGAVGVIRRHDLDLVTDFDEALGESPRVVLHSADAVSRDRDDADPHDGKDDKLRLASGKPSPELDESAPRAALPGGSIKPTRTDSDVCSRM